MTCWRRSTRFSAPFKKEAVESDAWESRILSSPLEKAGSATMAITPAIATTITSSIKVTPLSESKHF
jgi:hypothetical protein